MFVQIVCSDFNQFTAPSVLITARTVVQWLALLLQSKKVLGLNILTD